MADAPPGHAAFAFWNRTGNPMVARLLRSPLHGLASRRIALITVTGRRSGHSYTFPVMYSRTAERVKIPVGWPERKLWWRNLRDGADVTLRLRGADRTGRAIAHVDQDGGVRVDVELSRER